MDNVEVTTAAGSGGRNRHGRDMISGQHRGAVVVEEVTLLVLAFTITIMEIPEYDVATASRLLNFLLRPIISECK